MYIKISIDREIERYTDRVIERYTDTVIDRLMKNKLKYITKFNPR